MPGQKWKQNNPKFMGRSKSSSQKEVYSVTGLPQETITVLTNLILHLKELEKEEKTQSQQKERSNKGQSGNK